MILMLCILLSIIAAAGGLLLRDALWARARFQAAPAAKQKGV